MIERQPNADERYARLRAAVAWNFPELAVDRRPLAAATLRVMELDRDEAMARRLLATSLDPDQAADRLVDRR